LERKPQPVKFKIPKQRIETTPIKELERLKQRILILEEKNKDLQGQLGEARKKAMVLERTTNNAPKDPVIRQKDRQIVLLSQRLREMKLQISELNNRLHLTVDFVADLNDKVLIKKLRNLTMNEFEDKQFLKIREGDILLVKDPNIVSHKLLEILQDKVKIIITREKVTVKKGFVYLNASNLKLKQIEDYAIVGKQDLERELARANVLDNVLQSYREERFRE
jgi:predicted RNase H-like nuclease (RuvC/YqgF family)